MTNSIFWPESGIGALVLVESASQYTGYHLMLKFQGNSALTLSMTYQQGGLIHIVKNIKDKPKASEII